MKAALFLTLAAGAVAMELTKEDWDDKTAGKTVFVKFQAPRCRHCKAMKPAWDKLMSEYAGHGTIVVANVDCTAAGKLLCYARGVLSLTTIKYGDPNNLVDYNGGIDFAALSKFAKEELGPSCSPDHLDLCDAGEKKQIEKFMDLPIEDLTAKVMELQKQYGQGIKAKDAMRIAIKETGLGLMKLVQAHRKKSMGDL